jgi:hypothetical protein
MQDPTTTNVIHLVSLSRAPSSTSAEVRMDAIQRAADRLRSLPDDLLRRVDEEADRRAEIAPFEEHEERPRRRTASSRPSSRPSPWSTVLNLTAAALALGGAGDVAVAIRFGVPGSSLARLASGASPVPEVSDVLQRMRRRVEQMRERGARKVP